MKKKFCFVHNIKREELLPSNPHCHRRDYTQNVAFCWLQCWDWEAGESECVAWDEAIVEHLSQFEYVMFWLLTEPGKQAKYDAIYRLIKELRGVEGTQTIAYADGPCGWGYQMNSLPLAMKPVFLGICRTADHMMCYGHEESRSYWRAIRNGDNFHVLERPHPVAAAVQQELSERWRTDPTLLDYPWLVSAKDGGQIRGKVESGPFLALAKGLNNVNEERGIFSSLAVAKFAQKKFNLTPICHTFNPIDDAQRETYYNLVGLTGLREFPGRKWMDYLRDIAVCQVGVHLDVLETRGQFPLDCGCLGIPCICSSSVAGRKLWPSLYVSHPRDIDKACELVSRVMSDQEFRDNAVKYAQNKLWEYSPERIRVVFDKAVGVVKENDDAS